MENEETTIIDSKSFIPDVMIVKMEEDDYYVSEKLKGRDVYYKLLHERAKSSMHYSSLDEARKAAEKKRERLLKKNPECQIFEIDVKDYPKNKKTDAPKKPFTIEGYFYDEDGEIVFAINSKGKKVFVYRSGETEYLYIDKFTYSSSLDQEIAKIDLGKEMDFKKKGILYALKMAKNMALPYLYFEIYKAKEMLKSFEFDKELFECDILYYEGYIEGFNTAISCLKNAKLIPSTWLIHIIDLNGVFHQKKDFVFDQEQIGICKIVWHDSVNDIKGQFDQNELFLILIDKVTEFDSTKELSNIDQQHIELYTSCINPQKLEETLTKIIENTFFQLGKKGDGIKISEMWIPAVSLYAEEEK